MGAWGLSDRVGVEFGAVNVSAGSSEGVAQLTSNLEDLTGVGDPRMAPNWSAHSLVIGLREVQAALLSYDLRRRSSGDGPFTGELVDTSTMGCIQSDAFSSRWYQK